MALNKKKVSNINHGIYIVQIATEAEGILKEMLMVMKNNNKKYLLSPCLRPSRNI